MVTGASGNGRGSGDGGSALIIVLMMISMLGVLTLTVATLSVNNLVGARRAQQAGVALNAADAGLAQGVEYLRSSGVRALACSPGCPGKGWGNSADPTEVTIPGNAGASYQVWIEELAEWSATEAGSYRVHSLGMTGAPAGQLACIGDKPFISCRAVTQDVTVAPQKFPLGIFGRSIDGGGDKDADGGVHNQSIFSTGCVSKRSKIVFSGTDILNNNIPIGVHSSDIITEQNKVCGKESDYIHNETNETRPCNTKYKFDQDRLGGPLADTLCQGAGESYPQTSLIATDQELFKQYNLESRPLNDEQLDRLKTVAISQGNYFLHANYLPLTSPVWTSPEPNVVMYFDLLNTSSVEEVDLNNIPQFSREPRLSADSGACLSRSLVIIVNGGNVGMNSNKRLAASLFLLGDIKGGDVNKINGGALLTGTLYADNIDMKGGARLEMDECFKSNLSPALFDVETSNYREVDR